MLELAMMIEGQNGLKWARWMKWARAVEDLGFVGAVPLRSLQECDVGAMSELNGKGEFL